MINKALFKTILIYGVMAGVTCALYMFTLDLADQNPFGRYKYALVGVYAIFFAMAMQRFRDKYNGYRLGVRQGFFLGFGMNVLASIVYCFLIYIGIGVIDSDGRVLNRHKKELIVLFEEYKENSYNQIKELKKEKEQGKVSEEEYHDRMANCESSLKDFDRGIDYVPTITPRSLAQEQFLLPHNSGIFLTILFLMIFRHKPQ